MPGEERLRYAIESTYTNPSPEAANKKEEADV